MISLGEIVNYCKEKAFDLSFHYAKEWKSKSSDRVIVGYFPIYFPREIVHAVNGLPVGILGAGDRKKIIKGDAYYQSYICHIPRGIIEMALDDNLNGFDGFVFPSICDVIRNLSGMYKILERGKFIKYLDFPQNFKTHIGGDFYQQEMNTILTEIKKINSINVTTEMLNISIDLYNKNRKLIEKIYDIRQEYPWRLSFENLYYIIRAGMVIPVAEHNDILEKVCLYMSQNIGKPMDNIRVIISGSFCEQPPVGLIRTIENAGCYILDDDLLLGSRWIQGDIASDTDNPLKAIADAFINKSPISSSVYDIGNPKEKRLASIAKKRNADGVIFAAPSFCDPALLDTPMYEKAFNEWKIRFISFQYNENTGQYKVIKEQVGAFSDSIKLWEDELVEA